MNTKVFRVLVLVAMLVSFSAPVIVLAEASLYPSALEVCLPFSEAYTAFGGITSSWAKIDSEGCGYSITDTSTPIDIIVQPGTVFNSAYSSQPIYGPAKIPGYVGPGSIWVLNIVESPEILPFELFACAAPEILIGGIASDWARTSPEECGFVWMSGGVPHNLTLQPGMIAITDNGILDTPQKLYGWTGNITFYVTHIIESPPILEKDLKSCVFPQYIAQYGGGTPDMWEYIPGQTCGYRQKVAYWNMPVNITVNKGMVFQDAVRSYEYPEYDFIPGHIGPKSFWIKNELPAPSVLSRPLSACPSELRMYFGGESDDLNRIFDPMDPWACVLEIQYPNIAKNFTVQRGSVLVYDGGTYSVPQKLPSFIGSGTFYVTEIVPPPAFLSAPFDACPALQDFHKQGGGRAGDWLQFSKGCGFYRAYPNEPMNINVQKNVILNTANGDVYGPKILEGFTGQVSYWIPDITPAPVLFTSELHACPTYEIAHEVHGGRLGRWWQLDLDGDDAISNADGCAWQLQNPDVPINITLHEGESLTYDGPTIYGPKILNGWTGEATIWVDEILFPPDYTTTPSTCPINPADIVGGIPSYYNRILDSYGNPIGCGFQLAYWDTPRNLTINSYTILRYGALPGDYISGPTQLYFWKKPGSIWFTLVPLQPAPKLLSEPVEGLVDPVETFGGSLEEWEIFQESDGGFTYHRDLSSPANLTIQPGTYALTTDGIVLEEGYLPLWTDEIIIIVDDAPAKIFTIFVPLINK